MPFIASIRSVYGPIGRFGRIIGAKDAITGGIISSAGGYRIHTFNDVGTTNFNMSMLPSAMNVEYLIIAGGGAGGSGGSYPSLGWRNGGGAGGYRTGTISSSPSNYPVVVGFGGYFNDVFSWSNGGNSSFNGVSSTGGGTGGGYYPGNQGGPGAEVLPQAGGSGAGGSWDDSTSSTKSAGTGTSGQGYAGGNAVTTVGYQYNPFASPYGYGTHPSGYGGGGGAGSAGGNAQTYQTSVGVGGVGGSGISSSITGSSITRASGGGGSAHIPASVGNMSEPAQTPGGGGKGFYSNEYGAGATTGYTSPATSGSANTGGGGGGPGSLYGYGVGGAGSPTSGGSGVVILRYIFP